MRRKKKGGRPKAGRYKRAGKKKNETLHRIFSTNFIFGVARATKMGSHGKKTSSIT